jgi:hypothetical protein
MPNKKPNHLLLGNSALLFSATRLFHFKARGFPPCIPTGSAVSFLLKFAQPD